jgi:hypothetical protein
MSAIEWYMVFGISGLPESRYAFPIEARSGSKNVEIFKNELQGCVNSVV